MKVMKLFKAKQREIVALFPSLLIDPIFTDPKFSNNPAKLYENFTGYIFEIIPEEEGAPIIKTWKDWRSLHMATHFDLRILNVSADRPEAFNPNFYLYPIWPGIVIAETGERIIMDIFYIEQSVEIL